MEHRVFRWRYVICMLFSVVFSCPTVYSQEKKVFTKLLTTDGMVKDVDIYSLGDEGIVYGHDYTEFSTSYDDVVMIEVKDIRKRKLGFKVGMAIGVVSGLGIGYLGATQATSLDDLGFVLITSPILGGLLGSLIGKHGGTSVQKFIFKGKNADEVNKLKEKLRNGLDVYP